jgi:hypothetical protein
MYMIYVLFIVNSSLESSTGATGTASNLCVVQLYIMHGMVHTVVYTCTSIPLLLLAARRAVLENYKF